MTRGLWARYREYLSVHPSIALSVDVSRMKFGADFFTTMEPAMQRAFGAMEALEKGAIANPDEKRMVGHYWLRDSERAPTPELRREIEETLSRIKRFANDVHNSRVRGTRGHFLNLLVIGIGGSALGPEFVHAALGTPADRMKVHFFDNTDPDGMDRVLARLETHLDETLTVVISKSGGTKETRNGMLEAKAAYDRAGLEFGKHAVAVTGVGSELDRFATDHGFLARFPMWDWVGGRTSELSAVGLLPAALQGLDIQSMLDGARACDEVTRVKETRHNPAALLALMWHHAGAGKGQKDMVVLPYKDRLELFSRYLQQLVMESLGKEKDLDGKKVLQGIAVYGNKGSTDQHAYVQQLREGVHNFFVTFIEVLRDREGKSLLVEDEATAGDFLEGFFLGTRRALYENDRESITLTIDRVDARAVGVLIALYERAVGYYASLVGINAYHQPGVEAGKKAATAVLELQKQILELLTEKKGQALTVDQVAESIGAGDDIEHVFKILEHAARNPDHGIVRNDGKTPFTATYSR
ncbi:MAG: glucose-6-phosphate isomerase [Myxococcales bacterium]|nr:glucose-6-phosphate isomerase [Myxococcales bacterium]